MNSRPRLDIYINLPALRKLDAMLLVSQFFFSCNKWNSFSSRAILFILDWTMLDFWFLLRGKEKKVGKNSFFLIIGYHGKHFNNRKKKRKKRIYFLIYLPILNAKLNLPPYRNKI